MSKQELAREFEKWAVNKYGVRIKETDIKWWEERQEIWNACAELMSDELEKERCRPDDCFQKKILQAGVEELEKENKTLKLACGVRGHDYLLNRIKEYEQIDKDNVGKQNIIIAELEAENKRLSMETYEQMELMKKGIDRIKEVEDMNGGLAHNNVMLLGKNHQLEAVVSSQANELKELQESHFVNFAMLEKAVSRVKELEAEVKNIQYAYDTHLSANKGLLSFAKKEKQNYK